MAAARKMKEPIAKLLYLEKEEVERFENNLPRSVSLAEGIRALIVEDNKKNGEAVTDLSAIHRCLYNDMETKPNKSLDGWIEYIKEQEKPEPLIEIMPKIRLMLQLNDGRIRGMQLNGTGGKYSMRSL